MQDPVKIKDLIERGYTIVTAGARQAAWLRYDYAGAMVQAGKAAWETPDILPWQAWLNRCLAVPSDSPPAGRLLLNAPQQRVLWREIIQASPHAGELLQVDPVADQAIRAYESCKAWQIPVFPPDVALNRDARAFKSWFDAYSDQLDRNQWMDEASLPDILRATNLIPAENGVVLYGFDELTPQQQRLIGSLGERGCDVVTFRPGNRNRSASCRRMADPRAEVRTAAVWARDLLNREAEARIGVVVPDLHAVREQVVTIFDEVFHPESLLDAGQPAARLYSIAPGNPLSYYPVIHTALSILSLGGARHTLDRLGTLLRSPFIRDAGTEHLDRMRYLAALQRIGEFEWRLDTLIRFSRQVLAAPDRAGKFIDLLDALARDFRGRPRRQTPGQWADTFDTWLKLFGWPGERQPDSGEYQTLVAWKDALKRFASLGGVLESCDYAAAQENLVKIVSAAGFQPETGETSIQVSALPGTAGMRFDYLWVSGLHDQAWPPPASSNPFIPHVLQRRAGIPGASVDLVLERAKALTAELAASAGAVIFSFPGHEGDRVCRPSPVLRNFPEYGGSAEIAEDDYKTMILKTADPEFLVEDEAPAVSAAESPAGGAGIFRDQAACPFRAYARHRLFAESPGGVDIGLDPAVRGLLAHRTMQDLWQELKTSEGLRHMQEPALRETIAAVVDRVIRRQAILQPESFGGRFRDLESRRLADMAAEWLALERGRAPFTVREVEQRHVMMFHDLEVRMRIDRIDELADGSLVIIDYKTGSISLANWEGDRPDDPQLPLYAICNDGVAAIAYAGLKQGEYRFTGLAENDELLPGVSPARDPQTGRGNWGDRLTEWKSVLDKLAEDFLDGKAGVDPKNAATCRHCDLHTLCRVHERESMVNDSEE